jgi:hypothetical protein
LCSGLAEWNLLQHDAQQRLAENGARFAAVKLMGAESGSKPFSGPSPGTSGRVEIDADYGQQRVTYPGTLSWFAPETQVQADRWSKHARKLD